MEPKDHYLLWEKFCKVKFAHLVDRMLVKYVIFFLNIGLALHEDGGEDDLFSTYIIMVNNPNLTN